jgi:hypothetical protein
MKRIMAKKTLLVLLLVLGLILVFTPAALADSKAPAAPSNLTATVTSQNNVELNWQDNSNNEYLFKIYKKLSTDVDWGNALATVNSNTTTYTDTDILIGKIYNYKVVASNFTLSGSPLLPIFHDSADSNIVSAYIKITLPVPTLPKPSAPVAPANLSLPSGYEAKPDSVRLVWSDKSNDEDGFIIERRLVTSSISLLMMWLTVDETYANAVSYYDSGLAAGISYQYRVKAYKDSDLWGRVYSDYSNVLTITTAAQAQTPETPETPETPQPPATTYPGASSWAIDEIKAAVAADLTTPDILNNFQRSITREEFCEIAVKLYQALSGQSAQPIDPNPFADTANSEILKAYRLGIVKGINANTFAPNANITRQEICVMLLRTLQAVKPGADYAAGTASFADGKLIGGWALDAVRYMNKEGIMKGVGDNKIDPLGNTTREQAIMLVYRTFEVNK